MQFHALLAALLPPTPLPLLHPNRRQPLVADRMLLLEVVVRRRARTAQHHDPVLVPRALGKRPEAVFLKELVAVQELARRLAARHQEHVVAHQRGRVQEAEAPVEHHGEGHRVVVDGLGEGGVLAVHVDEDLREGGADEEEGEQRGGRHEGEEVAVVAPPDAVVEPHAVVVRGLDAVVAHAAVVRAGRPPDVAGLAVFGWHFHGGGRGLG